MEERIEQATGVLSGKQVCRLDSDNAQPNQSRNPCTPKRLAIGNHRGTTPIVYTGADVLLERIVGGFAGDDYVMHVALAQPCATDPHEARLLQQFRNGGRAAISHA